MGDVEREEKPIKFRKSLRNVNINYRNGWFFVTSQVAHNKSILFSAAIFDIVEEIEDAC